MDKMLTKYFWVFNLLTLALVAFLTAGGVNEIVASEIQGMLPQDSAVPEKTVKKTAYKPSARFTGTPSGADILKRNIFDSETGPITPTIEEEAMAEQAISLDGELPIVPCTDTQVKLLATVASPKDSLWSFANVDTGGQRQLVRIGDQLSGRVVSGISWRHLFLRGTSDECYIDMFGEQKEPVKKPKAREKVATGDLKDQIEVNSATERTVPRSVVDQAMANPTKFAKSVRVRPYKKNGETVGFRLRRIKKGSPLELLGAKRGDVIHSVNGQPLTDVTQALGAYQAMSNESRLIFSITRKGKPMDLTINIR